MNWLHRHPVHRLRRYRWCLPEFSALTADEFNRMADDPAIDPTELFGDLAILFRTTVVGALFLLMPTALLVTEYFYSGLSTAMLVLALAPSFVGVLIPAAVGGVWSIRRRVRREVLALFIPTNCPACCFEILGITPEQGAVTCPECGRRTGVVGRRWPTERARPAPGAFAGNRKRRRRRKRLAR